MPIDTGTLERIVAELVSRPGQEKVRALLHRLLTDALDARSEQIAFELRLPEVNGRVDALLGQTVIEIKTDLRRERAAAQAQLARYLPDREAATGQHYVGLATDGATFTAYEMRAGALVRLTEHAVQMNDLRGLLAWLEGVVAVRDWLPADAPGITNELGRRSAAFTRSLDRLAQAWAGIRTEPDAALKRQLWERHLAFVYGKSVGGDALWLQHTYLVIVAKAIAAGAMGTPPCGPADLLSGRPFHEAGVHGAVEDDFFSWILDAPGGEAIVAALAAHAGRFDLGTVDVDLLKVLYESLIDPEQRHDLGEYYTPDWLARKVVRRALDAPATQTCLDPACGSGSFLFHAVRAKREALAAADVPLGAVAALCCGSVTGFDVHPVAVIFARITYLLALGDALRGRDGPISLPVYLGDALQWNVKRDAFERDLVVEVPPDPREGRVGAPLLRFPLALCADSALFDAVVTDMHDASEAGVAVRAFPTRLLHLGVPPDQVATLGATYGTYDRLRRAGRDHVWGFIARNLSRPVAISDGRRVDAIIGNPPWLSYRFLSPELQARFRESAQRLGIWVGPGEQHLVTQTDLSGLFFARAAELYAKPGGRVAMVLPLAVLSRGQYRAFRTGAWEAIAVAFTEAWVLDNQAIEPLFRVPTCVLFATTAPAVARPTPRRVTAFRGRLPFKDAPEAVADRTLRQRETDAPALAPVDAASPYRGLFRNGATLYPRLLCLVERIDGTTIGTDPRRPIVCSEERERKGKWKEVAALRGPIEAAFLHPVYLGESIAPFRVLGPALGIVPVSEDESLLSASRAGERRLTGLARWLSAAEGLWDALSSEKLSFSQQIDHYGKLMVQFPIAPIRIVFAKAGKHPAACIVRDAAGIIDHKLYWWGVRSEPEARYLLAILNSETARALIAPLQTRGEQGERDFDRLVFTLPIPVFDPHDRLHLALAEAGTEAERVAASVLVAEDASFQSARRAIRDALRRDGVAGRTDALVARLLNLEPDIMEAGADAVPAMVEV